VEQLWVNEISDNPIALSAAEAEADRGLHRTLTTGQLSMIAIGGAIGTGLFLGSAFAIGFAGPAVLVSYAIGALVTLLLMGALAEMTVVLPASGSFGLHAERFVGPMAGFLVRYAYFSCLVLAIGTEVTAIAIYMGFWFPGVPGAYWIFAFAAGLVLVNALSVRVFGSIEYVFSMTKILAIVAFILLGAWLIAGAGPDSPIGFGNYVADGGFLPNGLWGMWVAVIIALFSYFSVEMIAVAAGEAEEPDKAIKSAFKATVFRLVLFYLLTLAIMLALVPWREAGAGGSPFVTVMAATGVPGAAGIINLVILVAALSAMNSQLYGATRMLFSLARAGFAPAALGRVSRQGVPLFALAVSSTGIGLAAIVYALTPETAFTFMISIAIFGALFTWAMIFVTHIHFRRRYPEGAAAFRMWGAPWTSAAGALLIGAILVTTLFTEDFRMTLVYGVALLALLSGVYLWRFGRRTAPD
jgi:amino acid transporter, AAT family